MNRAARQRLLELRCASVGDLSVVKEECLQTPEPFEVDEPGIGNLSAPQPNLVQTLKLFEVR